MTDDWHQFPPLTLSPCVYKLFYQLKEKYICRFDGEKESLYFGSRNGGNAMKKALAIVLLLATLLLSACGSKGIPQISSGGNETETLETQAVEPTTMPENVTEAATESFSQPVTEESQPTQPGKKEEVSTTTPTEESKPSSEKETKPATPSTTPTVPPTTDPPPTEETKPTEPPKETVTEPTTPTVPPEETKPTEPEQTEPAGCSHSWKCIKHPEEGHWRAGIICDCGWTVYGDPSNLVSLWNAHSASYPPAESLFDHGGFGSMDEWIVDKPAYEEWVCNLCGEKKE